MNLKTYLSLAFCVFLFFIFPLFGQKTMLINEALKDNSISYPIKRKGMNAVGKFTYGPYKTINPKGGITTSSSGDLFKSDVKASSKRKYSFDLLKNDQDTVAVNVVEKGALELDDKKSFFYRMITNVDVQINENISVELGDQPEYETVKNLQQTDANFLEKSTGETWQCIIVVPMDPNVGGYFFGGLISYRDKEIMILEVNKNEQKKTSGDIWGYSLYNYGYEFFQEGRIIAALQSHPMLKPNIWFLKDLEEKTQMIIASTIPVLLSNNKQGHHFDDNYSGEE